MSLSAPRNVIRLYAINYTMPVSSPYTIKFNLEKYIDFPLIISDSEFTGNYGSNYITHSPTENDLDIANQYSLSFNDIYSRYNEYTPFTLPGDNTDDITPTYINLNQYGIPNPSIRYLSGESGRIIHYTYGKNGPFYANANQKMFFVVTPSGKISPGIVFDDTIDICVYGSLGGETYYWETDYIYSTEPPLMMYRSYPPDAVEGGFPLRRGESLQFEFSYLYKDGTTEVVTELEFYDLSFKNGGRMATLDENGLLTISNECTASALSFYAKPKKIPDGLDESDAEVLILVNITNPLGEYAGGGTSQSAGGNGKYDGGSFGDPSTSDNIASELPATSTFADASSSGTYTKYLVNNAYLEVFGDWLWNTSFGLSIAQEVIKLIYGDPSESIISLMAYPFQLTGINGITYETRDFYWGNHNAGFQVPALTSTSGQVNWGTLTFDEYWGNFLDYSPHTKIQLYLPWGTGFVDINPDEVLPGTMTVVTTVELDKGSCVHNVFNHIGNVIGSYSGQCGKHVALMASDFSSKLANIAVTAVSAGVTLGAGITAGGVSKVISDAGKLQSYQVGFRGNAYNVQFQSGAGAFFSGAKESIPSSIKSATHAAKTSLAANKSPTHVIRNGSFTDSSAGLGIQFPYVILSRPTQSVPEQYGSYEGYPSNIYTQLRTIKGYTEISEIHLTDFESATVDEINKLEDLLKGGVIF